MVRDRRRVRRSQRRWSPQEILTMPVMPGLSDRLSLAMRVVTRTVRLEADALAAANEAEAPPALAPELMAAPVPAWTLVPTEVTVPKNVSSGYALALRATLCPTLISAMSFSETGVWTSTVFNSY